MAPATAPKNQHLSPLTTQWHNRSKNSLSSLNSDATTFHSAHATHFSSSHTNIELENQVPMSSKPLPLYSPPKQPTSPQKQTPYIQEPRLESIKMDRSDSGYEDGAGRSSTEGRDNSPRRQSTTSLTNTTTKEKKERRESHNPSSPRTSTSDVRPKNRPTQRRNPRSPSSVSSNTSSTAGNGPRRSTSEWRAGAPKPALHARHTTPYHRSTSSSQYPNSYFHFPPIQLTNDPSSHEQENEAPLSPQSPPPATVQYWTSDSTRRLEYAAIDAASKGVRGFILKLIPDCFLPGAVKRKRFHDVDADDASDAGSVRRYRLNLPEENVDKELQDVTVKTEAPKRPFLRRWTTLGGKGKAKSS